MRRIKLHDRALVFNESCLDVYPKLFKSKIDFIFTDPPYGHDNNEDDLTARREHALKDQDIERADVRPIQNDDFETANKLFSDSLVPWKSLLPKGGYVCCCCGGGGGHKGIQFARWSLELQSVFQFEQAVVWDKGPIGMGWHYRRSYEFVLVSMRPGDKPRWFDDSGRVENIIRPKDYGIHKIIPSSKQHATEKCPELAAHFIRLHTQPGDVVFDPFMGSGSTGVAALQLGRKFIGVELDPHWAKYATNRLQHVIKYGYDLAPAAKTRAKTTKQINTLGLWGAARKIMS